MKKTYNISSKSDMRRFYRDLEAEIMSRAEQAVSDRLRNACPNCGFHLRLRFGTNVCPSCGTKVEYTAK